MMMLGRWAMETKQKDVEFRVMPSGNGHWYWEVITRSNVVVQRGVADTEPEACQHASKAAREAGLIT
jgi:hypothetical protein